MALNVQPIKFLFFSLLLLSTVFSPKIGRSQIYGMYPPFTKWYQDPLGMRPIELSSAVGFAWSTVAIAASLIFTKNDSGFQSRASVYWLYGDGFGYKYPYTNMFSSDVGIMYAVRKWMSLGLGWNCFHFNDRVNNVWTTGIIPFARWYLYKGRKANYFFEYGAGASYSLQRFPLTGTGWLGDTARTGTKFNFLAKYGTGIEIHILRQLSLQCGMRHFHLSNGNIAGVKRNPSHDNNGFVIGLIYDH